MGSQISGKFIKGVYSSPLLYYSPAYDLPLIDT